MCSCSSTQVAASEVLVNAPEWVHGFVARVNISPLHLFRQGYLYLLHPLDDVYKPYVHKRSYE